VISLNGQILLESQQLAYLAGLEWGLFTTNLTLTQSTADATITGAEATWTGYSRQTISGWPTPVTVAGAAQSAPSGLITFTNGTGGSVTFYGWFVWDPAAGHWVAALNTGLITIPAGASFSFATAITDMNTGP
jgi:hypothetical protein